MNSPPLFLVQRVERILGAKTISWTPVNRGYTPAQRWLARTAASAVFVKCGATPLTARWLRREFRAYEIIKGEFLPQLIGWEDEDQNPILIIEDLSQACWPPPWTSPQVDRVLRCIEEMHNTHALMPSFAAVHGEILSGWDDVAAEPDRFLSLKTASPRWLDRALPILMQAERACVTVGKALTHWDIRSDNICITPRGVKLIDWPASCLSNPRLDLGFWLPSLAFEGGPLPEVVMPNEPEIAAWICGFFAARAMLPEIPDAPLVRRVQREQLSTALAWAIRALHLGDALP